MPIDKLLNSVSSNPALKGALGGAAGGALVTAMLGNKTARKAVKTGGLVALGGLAYKAYQSYQDGQSGSEETAQAQQVPQDPAPAIAAQPLQREDFNIDALASDGKVETVVKALVAAAHADGALEDHERDRIWNYALQEKLEPSQLDALAREIENPASVEELASLASGMEMKIEIYTASRLVIGQNCAAGDTYLAALGQAMGLPPGLIRALDQQTANEAAAA